MIPDFNAEGNLPPGVHSASWDDLMIRFGYNTWRQRLMAGLKMALANLKQANCQIVYLDGSFVTRKPFPNDYDACWDHAGVDLSALDPVLRIFDKGRAQQKAKYMGEFLPAFFQEGISKLSFLDFFQTDKATGKSKGIVVIDLRGLP